MLEHATAGAAQLHAFVELIKSVVILAGVIGAIVFAVQRAR